MVTLLAIFFSSFMVALSGALMPGPMLTVSISESARRGAMVGPLLIAGHAILELLLVVALFMGLAPLLTGDRAFVFIALAGAAILVWMAVGMFRRLPGMSLTLDSADNGRGHLVFSGILVSLSNPYWTIWWATIGLGLVLRSKQYGWWGVAFFFVGHILADLGWYSAISVAVSKGRHLMSDRVYRVIIGVCAAFLVGMAFYFMHGAWGVLHRPAA